LSLRINALAAESGANACKKTWSGKVATATGFHYNAAASGTSPDADAMQARRTNSHREVEKHMSTIEERVKKIVVEQLGVKEDEVTPNASFVDDLGADSLDTVELVMALEEEFECEIPDEEAEKITTVQQAIDYVKAHVKA